MIIILNVNTKMSGRFSLEAVNDMGFAEFTEVFSSVVEHMYTPLAAAAVWSSRPFAAGLV